MILKTENDVNSKETIILRIYGSRWLIWCNDFTEDCRKGMKRHQSKNVLTTLQSFLQ